MEFYLIRLCFSCLHLREISIPKLLKESGVQGSFSHFPEFSLLLFPCNIQMRAASSLRSSPLFLSILIWTFSVLPLSFLSLFPILLNFDATILFNFVSTQCGTLFWQRILAGPFRESFEASLLYPFWSLSWTHCTCPDTGVDSPKPHYTCCS